MTNSPSERLDEAKAALAAVRDFQAQRFAVDYEYELFVQVGETRLTERLNALEYFSEYEWQSMPRWDRDAFLRQAAANFVAANVQSGYSGVL